ncbi:hypothetical protein XhyaCFBP1156_01385 [Xanthomonas hyacinthi]|uniref:Uncharacterized protein n=1 Tax=Xanthomonas hyacinthi TaxID=56455 RepID=A0A2S7F3C1_9XANT|nr:hypothetical protein Y886_25875 [Xanthomonas hyacinthi DSM 19077]PPU99837.1 hypothetical protein XhyaCFBP1156_01385 [Xanthomonas hyacinthi]
MSPDVQPRAVAAQQTGGDNHGATVPSALAMRSRLRSNAERKRTALLRELAGEHGAMQSHQGYANCW